jgi:hypothetical protein
MYTSPTSSSVICEYLNKANQKYGTENADGNRRLPLLTKGIAQAVTESKEAMMTRKSWISLSREQKLAGDESLGLQNEYNGSPKC